MQIFHQLIESLKMELGIVKVNDIQQISFTPSVQSLPVLINIKDKWSIFSCLVRELRSPVNELIVKSFETGQRTIKINSLDCMRVISVNEGTIHPKILVSLFCQNESFHQTVRSEEFHLHDAKLHQHYLISTQVREKNLPILKIMRFKPSPFPKTDTTLKALEDFLMHYKKRIEKLEFIGYYKSVPIGSAKRYLIMEKDLVVELSQKKSKRVDLFVFKSANEYLFQVISQK